MLDKLFSAGSATCWAEVSYNFGQIFDRRSGSCSSSHLGATWELSGVGCREGVLWLVWADVLVLSVFRHFTPRGEKRTPPEGGTLL